MTQRLTPCKTTDNQRSVEDMAERILDRIRDELLELNTTFGVDSDLFYAGLDSMAIMQVLLMIEEEFGVKLPDHVIKRETFATARRIVEAVIEQHKLTR